MVNYVKKGRISSKKFRQKIEELLGYKPKNVEEKEEIDVVLMQTNDLLKYRDKITEAFKDSNFSSEHLKKSDDAAYGYVLESV